MNEKITMEQEGWEGHVNKDVLPSRFEFIKKAAEEGRLMKVEQRSGNKILRCPECECNSVHAERRKEADGTKKMVIGGKISITFFIDTPGEEIEVKVKSGDTAEEK